MQLSRYLAVVFTVATTFYGADFSRADVLITVNKEAQKLTVAVDGVERYQWPVSTARPGYVTPNGHYRPIRLERKWFSKKYDNSPMPYSIFFHGGYAIHGSYETNWIGRPVSHGCVRLHPKNAAILFKLVRSQGIDNTRVVVEGSRPPARQMHNRRARLSHAAPALHDRPSRKWSHHMMQARNETHPPRLKERPHNSRIYSPPPHQFVGPFQELFSYIRKNSH